MNTSKQINKQTMASYYDHKTKTRTKYYIGDDIVAILKGGKRMSMSHNNDTYVSYIDSYGADNLTVIYTVKDYSSVLRTSSITVNFGINRLSILQVLSKPGKFSRKGATLYFNNNTGKWYSTENQQESLISSKSMEDRMRIISMGVDTTIIKSDAFPAWEVTLINNNMLIMPCIICRADPRDSNNMKLSLPSHVICSSSS